MEERASALGDKPFIFRLNDNGGGPALLQQVCAERGWRIYQNGLDEKWNLWWKSNSNHSFNYKILGDWQFINHIPKGSLLCRKDNLSRLLRTMKKSYGAIYDFSPLDFHLPMEYAKLVSEHSKLKGFTSSQESDFCGTVWIHKPVSFSQGRGIFLFRNMGDIFGGSMAIVQKYIERPLLIAGYKFDLRLYACVPCFKPLVAYLYCEGLARFSTDKYTLTDIHNPYRHLTNSSLNKHGPNYAECKNRIGNGCKWTLKQLRRQLSGSLGRRGGKGTREWLAWQKIRAIVVLTLLAHSQGTSWTRNCFELFGFDVLLDENLKPWLLEVNLSPALGANCEADLSVKGPMLHELFDLCGLPMRQTGLALYAPTMLNIQEESYGSEEEIEMPKVSASSLKSKRIKRSPFQINHINIQAGHYYPDKIAIRGDIVEKQKSNTRTNRDEDTKHETKPNEKPPENVSYIKRRITPPIWGNGVQWHKAPSKVGNWIRVFPHQSNQSSESMKESVQSVSKLMKSARVVASTTNNADDTILENELRQHCGLDHCFQMWLPPV